jgi:hypothetical protein
MHSPRFHLSTKGISADWSAPKSAASAATIGVSPEVIARIHQLKALTVNVKAGNAIRNYKLVKSSNPDDLVFQSVKEGKPMRDNNILKRFIKPAANKVALSFSDLTRYLAGAGRRRSQVRPRPDAALPHLNNDGHLRTNRPGTAPGYREAVGVCK